MSSANPSDRPARQPSARRLTMADLARELGINKSTVSRALRGDPLVNARTREKIESLAQKLGYRPDPTLSALSQERWRIRNRESTGNWAILTDHADAETIREDPRFSTLFPEAEKLGYTLTPIYLDPKGGAALLNRTLHARSISGVFLPAFYSASHAPAFPWDEVRWDNSCWIEVSEARYAADCHRVLFNTFRDTLTALEAVRDHGYRRFVFYREESFLSRVNVRQEAAFLQFQASHPDLEVYQVRANLIDSLEENLREIESLEPEALLLGFTAMNTLLTPPLAKLPWASIAKRAETPEVSGVYHDFEELCRESVNFLDFQCRRRFTGIPARRKTLHIDCLWSPGTTLPRRDR